MACFVFAVASLVLIIVLYWFFGTERGASLRATGSNPNMSRAQGINTDVNKVIGLVLSNGIVAFPEHLWDSIPELPMWQQDEEQSLSVLQQW